MGKTQNPASIIYHFLQVVERNPHRVAVVYKDQSGWQSLTYSQLLEEAIIVASRLEELGAQKGGAVMLPSMRCASLCGSMLGILWIGGHYVFLDPNYPEDRQKFICTDVGARFGLFEGEEPPLKSTGLNWLQLPLKRSENKRPESVVDAELPAYIMYTSGSTGKPKGVSVPHRGVTRLVVNTDYINFDSSQVFLQLSALSFDASTFEIWGALLNGGTCVLHPENGLISPAVVQDTILSQGITTLWLTSSLYNTIISEDPDTLKNIQQLLTGGEVLSVLHVKKGLSLLRDTRLFNGYGPTENTTFTTIYPIPKELPDEIKRIPIGYPIPGTICELFDEQLKPVTEIGREGELIVFGDGVALGYLNRPDLTAERFIDVKCSDGKHRRGYRTGDIVVKNKNGSYDFLQRIDKQVKIDGHRIEPGEIELRLNQLDEIVEARVVVKTGPKGQKRLAAYYVGHAEVESSRLRSALAEILPVFMIPHFFVALPELPKNQNGKLDESKLPDPFTNTGESEDPGNMVADCWSKILGRKVGLHDTFLDAGGTSLEALQLTQLLARNFKQELGATFVFEYSTIYSQSLFFQPERSKIVAEVSSAGPSGTRKKIAIVGMACRFPGANNVDEYWQNLLEGKETISFFKKEELESEIDQADIAHKDYVLAKGIIDNCEHFDAAFFGISPLEAKIMDPQQRIMLQLAWHALEDAGLANDDQSLRIGVFAGMNWARYFQQYVLNNKEVKDTFGLFNASLANESDFLCSRISHKLNLKGPSINVFTACSTGLVAIAQACANIESGECEAALAGGVSVSTPVKSGYMYQEGSMLSKDGHCRPFDVDASGTTFNDGAGFVVLKRLDLAERDGDIIHAVIKGYAVNNDGKNKASFTAPSVKGQIEVYNAAIAKAGVSPESIGFIETHGTATPLGDPIELKALAESYSPATDNKKDSCAIGSVKSNIGHTIHAAGIASFIKTVKAVESDKIPATLHFTTPNPKLELEKTPFFVNNKISSWRTEMPRRAAVSSLGVGGTNAHVIIEQYVDKEAAKRQQLEAVTPHPGYPIFLSAKDRESLNQLIEDYQKFFSTKPKDESLLNVSYTSLSHRQHFKYRAAFSGTTAGDALKQLENRKSITFGKYPEHSGSKIGFMFSGQGSQRKLMGQWLYQNDEQYRGTLDKGCLIIKSHQGVDLKDLLFGESAPADLDINQTQIAQPALFLIEYGLAKYLQSCGCHPDFLIGHSIGEFTAAALAGVMSFEQAVQIVCKRGALMQSCKPGKMLAVMATPDKVETLITTGLSLAAVNAPDRLVLSGPGESIHRAAAELETNDISCSVLYTSHAFHSEMMEPIVDEFRSFIATMDLAPPELSIFSTATGKLMTAEQATDPTYWATQIRNPVRFAEAISSAKNQFAKENIAFVEVGPGKVLSTLVRCQNAESKNHILTVAPSSAIDDSFIAEFSGTLNSLWASGFKVNWSHFFKGVNPGRTKLPGYAFLPIRHWLSLPNSTVAPPVKQPAAIDFQIEKQTISMSAEEHSTTIEKKLRDLLEEVSGFDLAEVGADDHFSEIGLDSLLLTQAATMIDRQFSVGTTFRHLVEEYTSIGLLRDFIAEQVPPETKENAVENPISGINAHLDEVNMAMSHNPNNPPSNIEQLIAQQLQIMQLQLQAVSGGGSISGSQIPLSVAGNTQTATTVPAESADTESQQKTAPAESAVRHTPGTRITREKVGAKLTKAQEKWINEKLTAYQQKFAASKHYTQENRKHFADPRTVSGFNPEWKEIIFPIVVHKSKGSKIWDIDGNELIDTSNGFGPIFFGHSPDFVTEAVKKQIDEGVETGPQSPLAGEVARLFCELTGNERCSFASTGSEAVIGAIRLARTVTGRDKVVMFEGSYHGIFDEVINRPGKNHQALPAAPGIAREMTSNMLVLPWGDPESLEIIKEKGTELAAVLIEPVQSRHPDFHSPEYLKKIREITEESGAAMILDEVVTGFRTHPGGIRKLFDIDADLATYGKVIGGGYPIGIIGGKAKFMDALDGGYWEYGNDSIPECGVTFFAGTFVRHPVALAAAKAVLDRIKADGGKLYKQLEDNTSQMAEEAKSFITQLNCDVKFEYFKSIFYFAVPANAHWGHLLFILMTFEGIHTQQFRPNFLTTAHSTEDISAILSAFKKSLAQLVAHGLIDGDMVAAKKFLKTKADIPAGARLGKNTRGEPAYFIEDPKKSGEYIEVGKP
ncbi:amino acid adenylation domain-containing protein [Desulforhopalus sp. 52FAK]